MLYFRIDYHQPVPFCSYRPSFWFYSYIDDDLLFSFQVLVLYLRIIWFFFWFLPSWSAGGSGLWVFCRPLLFLYFFLVFCICISAAHSYSYLYFLNFVFLFLPPNIILIYTARPSLILVYTSFIPSACPLKIVLFGFCPIYRSPSPKLSQVLGTRGHNHTTATDCSGRTTCGWNFDK